MKVIFTRTAERRYRVSVEGPGVVESFMEPAPGYDSRLPHDMAHFVIENELGIKGGVFGQLAAGGTANTFHPIDQRIRRKLAKRGSRISNTNRNDAMLSESLVDISCRIWKKQVSTEASSVNGVTREDLIRVCRKFDAVSAIWSKLAIGESMTLDWTGGTGRTGRRRQR